MKKQLTLVVMALILICGGLSGCIVESDEYFAMEAKYCYIQSYPNGGGVFLVNMTPGPKFYGNVSLKIIADDYLNACLDKNILNESSRVVEITIRPDELTEINMHKIKLIAIHEESFKIIPLEVEMFDCIAKDPSAYIIDKKDEFIKWIEGEHPEFGDFSEHDWFTYRTYSVFEVEHWTFLSEDWEMRICCHITIPLYNWSKIRLRHRGEIDPVFAATCEYDGTKYEIPISEYPILYGY